MYRQRFLRFHSDTQNWDSPRIVIECTGNFFPFLMMAGAVRLIKRYKLLLFMKKKTQQIFFGKHHETAT